MRNFERDKKVKLKIELWRLINWPGQWACLMWIELARIPKQGERCFPIIQTNSYERRTSLWGKLTIILPRELTKLNFVSLCRETFRTNSQSARH